MKIVTAIKHPATALRNAFYYLTGNSIGRIFYPPPTYIKAYGSIEYPQKDGSG